MGEKVARSSKAKTKSEQGWQIAMAGLKDMVDQVIREKELERKRLLKEKRICWREEMIHNIGDRLKKDGMPNISP